MDSENDTDGAVLLGAYWLMVDSPAVCRPDCPRCGSRPKPFAVEQAAGRTGIARTVMVAVAALVVLAALASTVASAGS